jgi:hypothetical protein
MNKPFQDKYASEARQLLPVQRNAVALDRMPARTG